MPTLTFCALLLVGMSVAPLHAREFTQNGVAMEPAIKHREKIEVDVLDAFFYSPERWDVVLFQNPSGERNFLASRIVGLPGERVDIKPDGIYINHQRIELPTRLKALGVRYISVEALPKDMRYPTPYILGKSDYFLLGDNSGAAKDSRFFGPIERSYIAGRVKNK